MSSSSGIHRCEVCSWSTNSLFSIIKHLRGHQSVKCYNKIIEPYCCKDCSYKTLFAVNAKKHMTENHISNSKNTSIDHVATKYVCKKCKFLTYSALHRFRHSVQTGCPLVHNKCTQQTHLHALKDYLLANHENNENIKWFKCDKCPYRAKLNCVNFKWFQCKHCQFKTMRGKNLKEHVAHAHSKTGRDLKAAPQKHKPCVQPWFKCGYCEYKFRTVFELNGHFLSQHWCEEKIKLVECYLCPYKTRYQSELRRHVITDHTINVQWFKCGQCAFKSKFENDLDVHFGRMHTTKSVLVRKNVC